MTVPRSRLVELMKVRTRRRGASTRRADQRQAQCRIFSTTFNPTGVRTGNKVLRQRLKGPALAAYYPPRVTTFKDLQKAYSEFEVTDEDEEYRLEYIEKCAHPPRVGPMLMCRSTKARGKGAPPKKHTAAGVCSSTTASWLR